MIENAMNTLADSLRVHAAAMAELAEAIRGEKKPANEPVFSPAPVSEPVKAEDAMRGIPLPSEKKKAAPVAELAKPEPVAEQPKPEPEVKQPTLEDARKYVSRIIKWHSANNAGNPCPLDTIFEAVGAKRVQSLTPEQCATFCEQAEAFCKKAGA